MITDLISQEILVFSTMLILTLTMCKIERVLICLHKKADTMGIQLASLYVVPPGWARASKSNYPYK